LERGCEQSQSRFALRHWLTASSPRGLDDCSFPPVTASQLETFLAARQERRFVRQMPDSLLSNTRRKNINKAAVASRAAEGKRRGYAMKIIYSKSGLAAAALAVAVSATLLFALEVRAQDFPIKPITVIVPFPAGGSTDITLRAIAEVAGKHLGQPVLIDNKSGGSGTVGPATMAASAKPDGYTIAQMPITVFRMPLMQQTTWDPGKDFTYIIHLTGYTFGVTTSAEGPFKTWKDVVDYAKANPGKVTYATPGAGGSLHIGMEQITAKEGIKLTMVPFKGGAETNAAVLGQHTMLQADSTGWKPLVDAGKLRLLMLWTAERSPNYPNTPTLKELGFPFVFDSPFGLAGPKGMDPKVVKILHDAFKKAIDDPAVKATLAKYDMVVNYKNTEDYVKSVKEVTEAERKVVESLGLAKKTN
jgi:tripartite-type tricarboxylate transporter receptor subunit TctC